MGHSALGEGRGSFDGEGASLCAQLAPQTAYQGYVQT